VAALIGRTFIVTAADGYAIVAGSTISFTFENGQLGIRAGCNIIGGAYDIKDGVLATGAMMMTEMACEEPLMAQDTFISAFVNGARLTLDGATLTLAKDGVTLTATDETVARPDLPIEGTTWVVDGLIVNQAVSSMPVGVTAKVRFAAGRVEVDAGCNKGKGKAEIGDTAITFGTIGITKMACKDSAMAVEAHVLRVLRGDVAYTIDGDSLTLLGVGGGLMLKAQG
jgi:heat shock protein HslJ